MTTIQTYATRILQVALACQDVPRTDKADDVAFSDIAGVAQAILNEIEASGNHKEECYVGAGLVTFGEPRFEKRSPIFTDVNL